MKIVFLLVALAACASALPAGAATKQDDDENTRRIPYHPPTNEEIIIGMLTDMESKVKSTLIVASIALVFTILTMIGLYRYSRRQT
uniref:Uncharacterized protein n=1 Tax=Trichogramma kaykai TaxID=54128 RepID=A0ABD2X1P5_9HYME